MSRHRRAAILVLAAAAWLIGVVVGGWEVYAYSSTPGPVDATPQTWPTASSLVLARSGATVVMFVHPSCPCTRASRTELDAIVAATGVTPTIVQVADEPDDLGAIEAARFGAATSGFVVVYGIDGELRFAGGVTGSRGHAGDNAGRRAVIAAISGAAGEANHGTFGCALREAAP